jgi:hypothetical protein
MQSLIYETPGLDTSDEEYSLTDVFSTRQRVSRVQYPLVLILGFIVTGLLALMLAGFLGYFNCTLPLTTNGQPVILPGGGELCWHDAWSGFLYLREPWPLYLWFSGLMIVLQVSLLRSKELRRRLIAILVMTLISIGIVAVVYLIGQDAVVKYVISLLYWPPTYAIINFGLLLAFIIDAGRRWYTYVQTELIPARREEERMKTADPSQSLRLKLTSQREIGERISGDLIAAMFLCALLSLVFTYAVIGGVLRWMPGNPGAPFACGKTLVNAQSYVYPAHGLEPYRKQVLAGQATAPYACPVTPNLPVGPALPPPLNSVSSTDFLLAVLCFVPGVYVLAVTAFNRGLRVLEDPTAETHRTVPASDLSDQKSGDTGKSVVVQVAQAVSDTLIFALRQLIPYMRRVLISLRNILWPLLILIASFSLALCSRFIQYYLHNYDPTYQCTNGNSLAMSCQAPDTHVWLWLAIVSGLVGLLCTIFSVALLFVGTKQYTFTSRRVMTNTLQFLGRIGVVLLLTFWIFSFALFGFNWFLLDTGIVPTSLVLPAPGSNAVCTAPTWQIMLAPPHPACAQPFGLGWISAVSFAALIVAVAMLLLRLRRGVVSLVGVRTSAPTTGSAARGTTS